jgi:hypothetical protein
MGLSFLSFSFGRRGRCHAMPGRPCLTRRGHHRLPLRPRHLHIHGHAAGQLWHTWVGTGTGAASIRQPSGIGHPAGRKRGGAPESGKHSVRIQPGEKAHICTGFGTPPRLLILKNNVSAQFPHFLEELHCDFKDLSMI